MNIMLVSVTERTREIAFEKPSAQSAPTSSRIPDRSRHPQRVGGVIGVLFGSGISLLLRYG